MAQDPNQTTNNQSSAQGGADPPDQLEQMIKQAQSKSQTAQPSQAGGVPQSLEEDSTEENQKKMDEINQLKEQKAEEEKVLIAKQKELMKQVVAESPQTQKREEAKKEQEQEQDDLTSAEGYEIKQLSRIKIQKPT